MGKKIDLTGRQFYRLTVVRDSGRRTSQCGVIWECSCICGAVAQVTSRCLLSGDTKSCGCFHRDRESKASFRNLSGKRFGRLSVQGETGEIRKQLVVWRCVCDCGQFIEITTTDLCRSKGGTKSCGCLQKEIAANLKRKHGQSGTGNYAKMVLANGRSRRLNKMPKWANVDDIRGFYANCPEGFHVDHIIPLNGENVSGLHVVDNLQYLTVSENQRKGNQFQVG